MKGREEVVQFLTKKWEKENGYRLRKELFAFQDNRIAVQVGLPSFPSCGRRSAPSHANSRQFFYEWYEVKPDGTKQWYRCYGLEVCTLPVIIAFFSQHSWNCCRTGPLPGTVS